MIKRYGVVAIKQQGSGGDYTFDHTSSIQLFDSAGEFKGTLDFEDPLEFVLPKLRALN